MNLQTKLPKKIKGSLHLNNKLKIQSLITHRE